MTMTSAQLAILATNIAADGTLSLLTKNSDSADAIATAYNLTAVPDFWVSRTAIPVKEIYETTTDVPTVWSWTAYIARSQAERDAWREMTSGGVINASLTNVFQGVADIFSGAPGAAQRAHLSAMGRRRATRIEKLLATGTGSTGSPAVMGFEGRLAISDVMRAWGF